jgi:DNA adenine methylase
MLYPKPFLKWVGGKTQIIDKVLEEFPREINNYYEPFLGGGSVLLALLTLVNNKTIILRQSIYASDKNKVLIYVYKNIQTKPDRVINHLVKLRKRYMSIPVNNGNRTPVNFQEAMSSRESYYYWIRQAYNRMNDNGKISCKGSAYFVFLNKTCFRGLYRESSQGFNVSYGNYANPSIFDEDNINQISILIKNVIFTCSSFDYIINVVKTSDFVYLDPPYVRENKRSFVGYVYDDNREDDMNTRLFDICHKMYSKNILFLLSNSNTLEVKKQFTNTKYTIKVLKCNRNINSKIPNSTTEELLITWSNT